jgi:hypothetical protein
MTGLILTTDFTDRTDRGKMKLGTGNEREDSRAKGRGEAD